MNRGNRLAVDPGCQHRVFHRLVKWQAVFEVFLVRQRGVLALGSQEPGPRADANTEFFDQGRKTHTADTNVAHPTSRPLRPLGFHRIGKQRTSIATALQHHLVLDLVHLGQHLGVQAARLVDHPGQRDLPALQGKRLQGGSVLHRLVVPDEQNIQWSNLRIEQCGRCFELGDLGPMYDQLCILAGHHLRGIGWRSSQHVVADQPQCPERCS